MSPKKNNWHILVVLHAGPRFSADKFIHQTWMLMCHFLCQKPKTKFETEIASAHRLFCASTSVIFFWFQHLFDIDLGWQCPSKKNNTCWFSKGSLLKKNKCRTDQSFKSVFVLKESCLCVVFFSFYRKKNTWILFILWMLSLVWSNLLVSFLKFLSGFVVGCQSWSW